MWELVFLCGCCSSFVYSTLKIAARLSSLGRAFRHHGCPQWPQSNPAKARVVQKSGSVVNVRVLSSIELFFLYKLFLAVFKFLILWSLCWPVSVLRGVQKSLCLGLCLFVDVSEKSTVLLLGIQKLHREVQEAPADHWCLASLSGRFPCVKMLHADYGSYMLVWHASTKPEALPRRGT